MRNRLGSMLAMGSALALIAGCASGEGEDGNAVAGNEAAAEPVAVGGRTMDPNATIATNIGETDNLTRFVAAIEAAGLSETLEGVGPYTVFIPTDDAFAALPEGTIEALGQNARPELINILSYHIVPGVVTTEDLGAAIDRGDGEVVLATMTGATVTATRDGEDIVVRDGAGGTARLSMPDIIQSNGVIHVVDLVLNPGGPSEGGEAAPTGNETSPAPEG